MTSQRCPWVSPSWTISASVGPWGTQTANVLFFLTHSGIVFFGRHWNRQTCMHTLQWRYASVGKQLRLVYRIARSIAPAQKRTLQDVQCSHEVFQSGASFSASSTLKVMTLWFKDVYALLNEDQWRTREIHKTVGACPRKQHGMTDAWFCDCLQELRSDGGQIEPLGSRAKGDSAGRTRQVE